MLFAHPAFERSRLNRRLVEVARDVGGVHVHDLYEAYPDLIVDVHHEQARLLEHDTIVFQHPFFWYSSPALVKEWTDQVLQHGWAYGPSGTALAGKHMLLALTTGGGAQSYAAAGYNRYTIRQLIAPQEQTARLCRMRFLAPFVAHDAFRMGTAEIAASTEAYRETLCALVEERVDVARAEAAERIEQAIVTRWSEPPPRGSVPPPPRGSAP